MSQDKLKDFDIIKKIGEGSFGSVFLVKHIKTKDTYVLKKIITSGMSQEDLEDSRMEFLIHKTLRSPYIVKYQTHFNDKNCMCILLEYMDGGDLGQYLEKQNGRLLDERTIWNFFIQICLGIQYLHARRVLHRDLKSTNMFLGKDGSLKIGDLGVAKELKTNHASTIVGTPYYLSPELCEEKPYNNKSDIWSLGWILYELCTLHHPFDSKTLGGLYLKIIKGQYRPIASMYSEGMSKIIDACLQKECSKRPSIQQILENSKLIEEAKVLGHDIPSYRELTKEIKLQKKEFMSTFNKKKTRTRATPQPSKFYSRAKTQGMKFQSNRQEDSEKSLNPLVTNSGDNQMKIDRRKAQIDLISSEICDVVDDILHSSPEERKNKPSYLKYVRNPCSSKPNGSEISTYQTSDKIINQTEIKDFENNWINTKHLDIASKYKRANTTQVYGTETETKPKIDESILEAYKMLNNKRAERPSFIKPTYKIGVQRAAGDKYSRKRGIRKFTADDQDYGLGWAEKPPRPMICLPSQRQTHKKSDIDASTSSHSVSKNGSAKSARSLKEVLSPTNAKKKVQFNEPKSANKIHETGRSNYRGLRGMKKRNLDKISDQVNNITIELNSLKGSTKESENSSGKRICEGLAQKPRVFNRSKTKEGRFLDEIPEKKHNFLPNPEEEKDEFNWDVDENELDEALNYTDTTFEIEVEEMQPTPISTLENQPSVESSESFDEDVREKKFHTEEITRLKSEVKERWNLITTLTDETTAKKCFDYFKNNIDDPDNCWDQEQLEQVHKFIKRQNVKNYRAMGFECFRLLSSYKDLNDHKDKLSSLLN